MNDIVVTQGFEDLLEDDTILAGLKTFALDFEAELSGLIDVEIDMPSTLSSTLIQFSGQSLDTTLPQPYTVSVTGSGFTPVSSPGDFETAIVDGTAAGDVQSIRVAYGGTEILSLDVDRNSYLLTSGDQSIELGGTFPSSLQEFGTLITIGESFDNLFLLTQEEIETLLQPLLQYELTDLVLRGAGAELLSMSVDSVAGTLTAEADGYTLTAAFPTIPLAGMPGVFDPTAPIIGFGVGPITLTDPQNDIILHIPDTIPLNPLDLESFLQDLEARTGLTLPPLPEGLTGWNSGDPHLLTLDGAAYDFHAVGEYVLLRGQTGEAVGGFEIQSRMTPATDDQGAELDNVSVNAAIAMRAANGDAVMIDSTDAAPLSVGGVAQQLADGDTLDVGNDRIFRDGDIYTMVFAGADGALGEGDTQVAVVVHDARVDLSVRISADLAGRVEGLLGDGDGEIGNDIARADGTALDRPLAFDDLYGGYRDDWRVDTEGDSLFTYDTGESLAGFYDPAKPGALTTLDDFEAGDLAAAQQAAEASGLTPGSVNYDNAVFDFLLTGDQGFIDSAASKDVAAPDTASTAPTLDVGQGRATLNINVTDRAGDAVEGASVGFTAGASTARSLADDVGGGAYALSVGDGASGQVGGTLGFTNAGEITAGDALEVLRIAVGLNPSWGPAQGLDFVAADLNGDARVMAGDALEVLRAAVGLDSEHAPEWVFIDPDQDVSAASANDVPELGGVDIAAISGTQNVDMTAVLLGNMESFACSTHHAHVSCSVPRRIEQKTRIGDQTHAEGGPPSRTRPPGRVPPSEIVAATVASQAMPIGLRMLVTLVDAARGHLRLTRCARHTRPQRSQIFRPQACEHGGAHRPRHGRMPRQVIPTPAT